MTETPRPWDHRSTETTKAYAAFRAYIALGARRSVREALRQNSGETAVSGKLRTWEGWSSKNAWVSRANARDEWIARTSDDRIIINILACKLTLVTRAHDFLTSTDSAVGYYLDPKKIDLEGVQSEFRSFGVSPSIGRIFCFSDGLGLTRCAFLKVTSVAWG